eukprot:TRINITY_DN874_c0_g1_i1.p1 TRINITY_DN874_c0_g1~~TRINITY_DN874_c0_g1_i1.p1  ORF type:complete len:787 (+),score=124.26 TRINITY_DN874_c0_g1_i1:1344-3704(+)
MEPTPIKPTGPTVVSVANDPGSAAWAPQTPPVGSFNMTIVEGKDLSVKDSNGFSDPYVKVFYPHPITRQETQVKSLAVQKNLNPSWNFASHTWVLALPLTVRIEVWDEDLLTDDFMGTCQFQVNTDEDLESDVWIDLAARPGKKDKNIKGQIRVRWSIKFMKNFKLDPAKEWTDFSMITIEPIPIRNVIDVQGSVDDFVILNALASCRIKRLPEKHFSKSRPRESIGWVIKVCTEGAYADAFSWVNKAKWDLVQNTCLRLLNHFATCGFWLLRGDQIHIIRAKHPRKEFDPTLCLVRERTAGNVVNQPTFILVEPYYICNSARIRVEVQGNVGLEMLTDVMSEFSCEERRDSYGDHISYSLVDNVRNRAFVTLHAMRMRENVSQNLILKVMNQFHKYGFTHWTVWGEAHIMMRSEGLISRTAGDFVIVDPLWLPINTTHIEVQGIVNDNLITQIANTMVGGAEAKLELQKRIDESGKFSCYSLKSKQVFPATALPNLLELRRSANVFQNMMLEVVSKLGEYAGYETISPFGTDCILLQKSTAIQTLPPSKAFKYVLIDPCLSISLPAQFEIQGDVSAEQVAAASAACGCDRVFEESDPKFGHSCWIIPIAKTSGMSWTPSNIRRKMNKVQFYGVKLLSHFHNVLAYEPFMQYGDDSFLCRLRDPATLLRGQYILIDILFAFDTHVRVEVTGDISKDEVAAAAAASGLFPPQNIVDFKDNGLVLGYFMRSDVKANCLTLEGRHKTNNRWQFYWINFVNRLASYGWRYKFPYGRGRDRGWVFFRPLSQ